LRTVCFELLNIVAFRQILKRTRFKQLVEKGPFPKCSPKWSVWYEFSKTSNLFSKTVDFQ